MRFYAVVLLDMSLVLLSRDDPGSTSCILASNIANRSCEIKPEAENIFAAVRYALLPYQEVVRNYRAFEESPHWNNWRAQSYINVVSSISYYDCISTHSHNCIKEVYLPSCDNVHIEVGCTS